MAPLFARGLVALGILALASGMASCGGDGERTDGVPAGKTGRLDACPNDLPDTCALPAPTYDADVGPLIARYCVSCHSPGGAAPNRVFDTFALVKADREGKNDIYKQLYACRMPPAILPQPTLAEREAILSWYVCGLPEK